MATAVSASLTLEDFLKQPATKPARMNGDRLPIPQFLPLELIVDQVFGWLKVSP